jgi:hypothetical protein
VEKLTTLLGLPAEEGYPANVEYVEDRTLAGLDEAALAAEFPRLYPEKYEHPVVFVADSAAMSLPDYPVLVVNLNRRGDTEAFRVTV